MGKYLQMPPSSFGTAAYGGDQRSPRLASPADGRGVPGIDCGIECPAKPTGELTPAAGNAGRQPGIVARRRDRILETV